MLALELYVPKDFEGVWQGERVFDGEALASL
jgi:hypothetical protein